jgi:hypothetical protein
LGAIYGGATDIGPVVLGAGVFQRFNVAISAFVAESSEPILPYHLNIINL